MSGDVRFLKLSDAPQYLESTWALIEKGFPHGEKPREKDPLDNEFALLLNPQNHSRIWICVQDDQVISTSSWRFFDVVIPGRSKTLPCAGVGLVVTDSAHRKKGYAAKLQTLIEKAAVAEGALLSLLWSDLHDFYMKQGYLPAGTEYMWTIDKKDIHALSPDETVKITKLNSLNEIISIYESQKQGPKRNWPQYNTLLELSDTYGWIAKDATTHTVLGYALMGKARDLRNTVHEICGDPRSIEPLLYKMGECIERKAEEMRLQIPADSPLKSSLSELFGPPELSALSYMKILDTAGICNWINTTNTLPTGMSLEDKKDQPGFVLRNKEVVAWDSPDEGHLLQLFFGPWKPAALSIPKALKTQLADTQSIGIYFWGFDSV